MSIPYKNCNYDNILGKAIGASANILGKVIETIKDEITSPQPVVLTMKDIISYTLDRQTDYPEIVATRIAFFEQQTGEKVFTQTMVTDNGEPVFTDTGKQNLVGRIFPKLTIVTQEIKELLSDNVECIIQLPETLITFKDVLEWGQNLQKNNSHVSAVRFNRFTSKVPEKPFYTVQALDSNENEIFADSEKKTIFGKNYPHTAKIDERLEELLENDVTCIIPLE